MFFTIFFNEIKYWFGRPALYIYTMIFLFIALMISGSAAGLFDFLTVFWCKADTGEFLILISVESKTTNVTRKYSF